MAMIRNENVFYKIKDFILDLVFPRYCVGCSLEGEWFCQKCRKKIIFVKAPACPKCGRLTPNGQFCSRCRDKSFLTGLITAAYYRKSALREAIHTFKYDEIFDLKKELGKILIKTLFDRWKQKSTILVPVPLAWSRKASRGFNQTELLAQEISKVFGWLICDCLKRIKHTKPQVVLSGKERQKNVKGVFVFKKDFRESFKNKTILLIDDVYTTGSTLQECAKVLRENSQVKQIWGLVLAKV